MTPDPKTGLVEVLDRETDTVTKMFPVDAREAFKNGGVWKKDGKKRFVYNHVAVPTPETPAEETPEA